MNPEFVIQTKPNGYRVSVWGGIYWNRDLEQFMPTELWTSESNLDTIDHEVYIDIIKSTFSS